MENTRIMNLAHSLFERLSTRPRYSAHTHALALIDLHSQRHNAGWDRPDKHTHMYADDDEITTNTLVHSKGRTHTQRIYTATTTTTTH